MNEGQVTLIVQADDYGACPAITDGILACHAAGVVTQASVIVPGPDAARGMWLARRVGLPLGAHLTLFCEWELHRWYPLTTADSLRAADGAFVAGLDELRAQAHLPDARTELRAQLAAAGAAGITLTHFESHVRVFDAGLLAQLSAETGLPCRDPVGPPGVGVPVDSVWHLSVQPTATKTEALLAYVAALPAGRHMIVAHPADDTADLTRLCHPTSRRWKWAREIRVSDSAALLDRRFRQLCHGGRVRLASLADLAGTRGLAD